MAVYNNQNTLFGKSEVTELGRKIHQEIVQIAQSTRPLLSDMEQFARASRLGMGISK